MNAAENAPATPSTDSDARFVLCTQVAYGEELPEGARLHFSRYTRAPILPVRGLTMHYESDPLPLDTARAVLLALACAGFPTAMKTAR